MVDAAGLKWIGDGNIKEGGEAIGKVRVHNVTRAALCVPTNPLLSLSVWVIKVQRLPDDVSEGIMATDLERTKLATQPMVSVYIYWALASTDVVEGLREDRNARPDF